MKDDVEQIVGQRRLVPIYDEINDGNGNNLKFHIVQWGVITVTDSHFHGSKNTYLVIEKSYLYSGKLVAHPSLSEDMNVIEGAFASPVLIE